MWEKVLAEKSVAYRVIVVLHPNKAVFSYEMIKKKDFIEVLFLYSSDMKLGNYCFLGRNMVRYLQMFRGRCRNE